jgi:hypothetical protein
LMVVGGALSSQVWVWHKTNKLWKIVSGSNDISTPVYGTPRQPGSTFGTRSRMGYESGLNAGGQLVVFGGVGLFKKITNDMWIVPQDVCTIGNLKICLRVLTQNFIRCVPATKDIKATEGLALQAQLPALPSPKLRTLQMFRIVIMQLPTQCLELLLAKFRRRVRI